MAISDSDILCFMDVQPLKQTCTSFAQRPMIIMKPAEIENEEFPEIASYHSLSTGGSGTSCRCSDCSY